MAYEVLCWLALCLVLIGLLSSAANAELLVAGSGSKPAVGRPNIVLILADDLGFSDTQPYGGEIHTPTISALASQGVRFTNYHSAANCAPARAMLLTGVTSHRAGVGNIPETVPLANRELSEYRGVLGDNVVTVATLLEDAGYHTYISGKWHLGHDDGELPYYRGFERSLALADSGADNWEPRPYLPIYDQANWYADGVRAEMPGNFYSSELLTNRMIEFIDKDRGDGQPFFAYLPFQAVHHPVQAPQEFIDRYANVYDEGWDALRIARLQRAVALGIVPKETAMSAMTTTQDWQQLSDDQRRYQSKSMAVYAAMVEAMDFHLGRLVEHLKDIDQYSNTLFIFTSDNGPEASGLPDANVWWNRFLMARSGYSVDYEGLGLRGSYSALSPSFASAAAAPLAYYKFYTGEGGLRVPLIFAGDLVTRQGEIDSALAFATDVPVTILGFAEVDLPKDRYAGRPVESMTGRDLAPLLNGSIDRVYRDDDAVGYELAGQSALFRGDYKLSRNRLPVGDNSWKLHNIVTDPGETTDLRDQLPELFDLMRNAYDAFASENNIVAVDAHYDYRLQILLNGLHDRAGTKILTLLLTFLFIVPFYIAFRKRRDVTQ